MPPGVRALLQSRLDGVDEIGWQLLHTAAVIGRSFNFDTCRLASGRSEEEAVAALEGLLARGLIEEVPRSSETAPAPQYDFSHNQMRALVYDETSLVRRRLLHRRVAEALAHNQDPAQAAQIAHHYHLAGQDGQAADYFGHAGEHARSLYANASALSHLRTALALGHPDVAALHEAIGDLHTLLGEYGEALDSYEAAAAHAAPQHQAALEHKLGNVYDRRGDWQRAESHFQAALAAVSGADNNAEQGAELQARILADWSLAAHHRGGVEAALSLAQRSRELARQAQDDAALAQVHNILGILARHRGNMQEAQQHLQRSLSLATESGLPSARIAALNNLALVYGEAGQEVRALEALQEALRLCHELGDRHREAALLNNLADLHHGAGRSEEAMSHLKRAAAIFAEIGGNADEWQPEIWKLSEW
jgi:tetratricopeptide (TPR) repeat protein